MITGKEIWNMMGNYSGNFWPAAGSGMWPGAGMWGAWSWALILPVLVIFLGVWIYTSLAYMEIARKLKYKNPWLAWIPFARGAMVLQLGGFNWGWIFLWSPLVLLPLTFLNWGLGIASMVLAVAGAVAFMVLCYISHWRFFEKRGYYGWLALAPLIGVIMGYLSFLAWLAFLVILGFVAWKDGKMVRRPAARMSKSPARRSSSRSSRGRSNARRRR